VLFKIPYPGWVSVGTFALTEAFEMAAKIAVVDVTVSGGGKVARVKFFTETAASLAIFRITRRIIPNFPGLDGFTTIDGHLKPLGKVKFNFNFDFFKCIIIELF
jgi:hypothetical protein